MTFATAALIMGGATLAGGLIASSASRSAANTQANAAQAGIDAQERMFNRQTELQEPWRKAGEEALNKLIPLASNYTPFGMNQFQQDPGYAFRLSEGMKALDRTAAARGGLLSGSALKGASRYGQDLASQEYQNAFNRYQTERAAQLNPLQSLAGVGQSATNTLTGTAGQMGQNYATGYGNIGNAQASGYLGGANALNQAIGNAGNIYSSYGRNQMLSNMFGNQGNVSYIEMGGP
jgi:hypothetical protein